MISWLPAGALSLAVVVTLPGCSKPVELPSHNLEKADKMIAEAVEQAHAAVEQNPGSIEAWNTLGSTYYANGFAEPAIHSFTQSLQLNQLQPLILYLRGLVWREQYNLDASLADLESAIKLKPGISHLHWRAAWVSMENGELLQAQAFAESALGVGPEDHNAIRTRARIHLEAGTAEQGVALLEPLVAIKPNNRHILWLYTRLLRAAGRGEEAGVYGELSGTDTPVYSDPWALWAMTRKTGKAVEIRRVVENAANGDMEIAEASLRRLIRFYPDDQIIPLLEGLLLKRRGNREEALLRFEALCEDYPDWAAPRLHLGLLLLARDQNGGPPLNEDVARARDALEVAVELDPGTTNTRAVLSRALLIERQWEAATEHLRVCVAEQPLNYSHRISLAGALFRRGKPGESLSILDDATRILIEEPTQAVVLRTRALMQLGRQEEAGASLEHLRQMAPNHPAIPQIEDSLGAQTP